MATVTLRDDRQVLEDPVAICAFLEPFGIWYRRFEGSDQLGAEPSDVEILAAYAEPIEALKAEGGYVTADVINVNADTPNLDAMLARFNKEHFHDEDEVRFIVHGRGLFHIHPPEGPVFAIEVEKGDMIRVPRGTHHWFDLCADRTIRAVRLFQDMSGWTPHYTASGAEGRYQPLCFGPFYMPHLPRPALG
jgi:1,2-dihydroxy-3-keto-5-methylthiopentene dioxygenase